MNFDVQINTSPDSRCKAADRGLQVDANLRLRGTASNPALLGASPSPRARWFSTAPSITINQGSISFFNPLNVEPVLDIDLETKARGIDDHPHRLRAAQST